MMTVLMAEEKENVFKFNIAGRKFRISRALFGRNPLPSDSSEQAEADSPTLLKEFFDSPEDVKIQLADHYLNDSRTYFFDRNPDVFAAILDFYRTGVLHYPIYLCPKLFLTELRFWRLDSQFICGPCEKKLGPPLDSSNRLASITQGSDDAPLLPDSASNPPSEVQPTGTEKPLDQFSGVCLEAERRQMWTFLEDPTSSCLAKLFAIVSVGFIILSVSGLVIGSLQEFQEDHEPLLAFQVIEYFCIAWFTFEYTSRLLLTPRRWDYIREPLIVVDALAIFPFYLELLLKLCGFDHQSLEDIKGALLAMRVLRVARVARILRLARYSDGMKYCAVTLRASSKEVGMLVLFVFTMIILFSTTVYFLEKDNNGTVFTSIPATFWWCTVTITTVGYGDMTPETFGGRLVASLTSVAGVIVLAFPITMIVENFYRFYKSQDSHLPTATPTPAVSNLHLVSPRQVHTYTLV